MANPTWRFLLRSETDDDGEPSAFGWDLFDAIQQLAADGCSLYAASGRPVA
jgi:hypothetical protein